MWRVTLTYQPKRIRKHGFAGRIDGPNAYLLLKQVHKFTSRSTLSLLVNANSGIATEYQNFSQVFPNITPQYCGFYPNHPSQHYLQIGSCRKYFPLATPLAFRSKANAEVSDSVGIRTDVDAKAFKRQIASLHNLYNNKDMEVPRSSRRHSSTF